MAYNANLVWPITAFSVFAYLIFRKQSVISGLRLIFLPQKGKDLEKMTIMPIEAPKNIGIYGT